jgi:hypothetical protein
MKLDHARLVKLMRMTEANNDGEALNALRLANRLLKNAGKHWGDVIPDPAVAERTLFEAFTYKARGTPHAYGQPLRRAHPPKPSGGQRRDSDIGVMLGVLATRRHDMGFLMFLAGVTKDFKDKGYLTNAQYDAVKRAYTGKGGF